MSTRRFIYPRISLLQALLLILLFKSPVFAQDQLLFVDLAGNASPEQLLPEQVDYQRGIRINNDVLDSLTVGEQLLVQLLPGQITRFELDSRQQYLNGDTAWRGVARTGGRLQTLTLIVNTNNLLGNVNLGDESWRIITERSATDGYTGYLFTEIDQGQRRRIDDGGIAVDEDPGQNLLFDVSALSGNDVSIVQTLSSDYARIGDQLTVSIAVKNNLSSAISGESLNVLFILDDTNFVSSSSACSPGSTGAQSSLVCNLPTIEPGATATVEYTVQISSASYPQVASGVFVGDVFGNNVRNDAFVFVYRDTLLDSDNDGQSDFNEAFTKTDPNNSASVIDNNFIAEIDLMFLYTDRFVNASGNVTPETRVNELVEITNGYYANSSARIRFRPVYYNRTSYTVNDDLSTAFSNLRNGNSPFQSVNAIREAVGADIVVLVDGLVQNASVCGLGTTPGVGFEGEFYHPTIITPDLHVTMFTPGSGCSDIVLAHELGHNLGLNHSRRESGARGTFDYALGHGVNGSFVTIMASPSDYPGASKIALFSNPDSNDCNGLACGVSRNDTELGADAVFTLNHTRHQVANRRTSRVLPITSLSGSSNLIMYGGASRSSDNSTSVSVFSAQDSIDVSATLLIPSEHQGQTGQTYAVISVAGAGFFYRDANGAYQNWDGALETLQGTISPRALNASETVAAFENFVPSSVGVDAASVTVFFAYSVSGSNVFVYSSNGVPFSIQP
ncbi:MAG: M12 family metallo-peptidase [Proteobacteria bacterium]|nr:M12 family metallo-peptidase [Pseudomonadota bacterium]MDA0928540.1 M12 family metallo-peptidase [Pseudomonadota bacterium]